MSQMYQERVETVTHRDWMGMRCDRCGAEHLFDRIVESGAMVPMAPGWTRFGERDNHRDLCGICVAVTLEFIGGLKP